MNARIQSRLTMPVAEELVRLRGVDVTPCTECGACTDVCPVVSRMDVPPADLMTQAKQGAGEDLLAHASPWVCTDCRRCSEVCPVGIDVARAMEGLRLLAHATGQAPSQNTMVRFHELFLKEVAERGRLHELSLIWRLRHLIPDWRGKLAFVMLLLGKRKLPLRIGSPGQWPGPQVLAAEAGSQEPAEGEGC